MPDDFGQRVPYMIRMVNSVFSQQLERTLRRYGVTYAQLAALAQLGLESPNPLSAAELGHRAGVTAQSMSNAITSLLDRGLVDREPNPAHGRILDIRITPAGAELVDQVQDAMKVVEDRAMAPLSPKQQRDLRAILRQMMVAMDLYLP